MDDLGDKHNITPSNNWILRGIVDPSPSGILRSLKILRYRLGSNEFISRWLRKEAHH